MLSKSLWDAMSGMPSMALKYDTKERMAFRKVVTLLHCTNAREGESNRMRGEALCWLRLRFPNHVSTKVSMWVFNAVYVSSVDLCWAN